MFCVLWGHEIISWNNESFFRIVHARMLLWVDESLPKVLQKPSLFRINSLSDIVFPFREQSGEMIPNISFFGNKVHVEREYVLALKEDSHPINIWLALQELFRNWKYLVFNFFMINPTHWVVQVVILVQEFKWKPDRQTHIIFRWFIKKWAMHCIFLLENNVTA